MSFSDFHAEVCALTQTSLQLHISALPEHPSPLLDAMGYSLFAPGKRVRPLLVSLTGTILGLSQKQYQPLADAIEVIHTYSLIHDDLPAMDDDATRRGQPTCHIKFDEGMAILAGDALQTLAFDIVLNTSDIDAKAKLRCLQILSNAAGFKGMCGGQAIDLAHTDQAIDIDTLTELHQLKTGALLNACVAMPLALAQDISAEEEQLWMQFATTIGLAFQVQDDILDITADSKTLGKPSGSDVAANKSTFPSLLGLTESQTYLTELYTDALDTLSQLPYKTDPLRDFVAYIIKRTY